MRGRLKILAGLVVALVVLATAGTYVYINFIREDAPPPLAAGGQAQAPTGDIAGTWRPGAGSQFGYRVNEVLFGQSATAVGRTDRVTGAMVIDGTTVTKVDLTVDMASIKSDSDLRDGQYRGRIMAVDRFRTSTFVLTQPIALASIPDDTSPITVKATGDLTLRGTTKPVTVDLEARRNGVRIEVNGAIPIVFAEWNIPNPSFASAQTEDHGSLELLVIFERAGS